MPRLRHGLLKYRCKIVQSRRYGVITLDGKNQHLGRYDSPESYQHRDTLLAEWLAPKEEWEELADIENYERDMLAVGSVFLP